MNPEPKPIVIDKCALQGAVDGDLCSLAKSCFLVLPHDLYGEIVTDDKAEKRATHLRRFSAAMRSGAYWGPSVRSMVEKEAKTLAPYGFLADLDETRKMRDLLARGRAFDPNHVADVAARNLDSAKVLLDNSREVCQTLILDVLAQADTRRTELENSREARYSFWVAAVDGLNLHAVGVSAFQQYTQVPGRFCLSKEWVSWQYIRLSTVLSLEYTFLKKGQGGGREQERAEHDLYDVQYVILLSRADAIITSDRKLVEPLARVAFPEKDVFSSLEEVPESYRCDWAGD